MLSKDERTQAIKFQDAIGEIIDQYIKEGMDAELIREVLRDEASSDLNTWSCKTCGGLTYGSYCDNCGDKRR